MNDKLENKTASSTVNKILVCAKAEFLAKGFKDASLRNIAKEAGVTTGAIYGYFKDKNDIFVTLVKDVVAGLHDLIEKIEGEENPMLPTKENHIKYLDYLYDNFEVSKLIFMCSNGSSMENCMDLLMEQTLKENQEFIRLVKKTSDIDEFTIYIILEFYFKTVTEFIKHDIPYEVAIKQFDNLNSFFFAGWNELLKHSEHIDIKGK